MRRAIVNSTPLIALAKCDSLSLLHAMYDEVIIPEAVFNEICAEDDIASRSVRKSLDWIIVKKIQHPENKKYYRTRLHDGEVEVMILAQEIHADAVIIDDLAARSTADYYSLPIVLRGSKDNNIRFRDLQNLLDALDFLHRTKGDHFIYWRDGVQEIINIQPEGNKAKPYQVKQVRNLILKYHLEVK